MKKHITIDFVQWTIDISSNSFVEVDSPARACTQADFVSNIGLAEEVIEIGDLAICPQSESLVL